MPEPAPDRPSQCGAAARPSPPHYDAIEATLLKSRWGRAFLAEYGKRNRNVDTDRLLEAIAKLEKAILRPYEHHDTEEVFTELVEMSDAIAVMRREIAAIKPPIQIIAATEELESVVKTTEKATSDILQAAEEVQEVAWTLRDKGAEVDACEMLDRRATEIYTACSFQDITGQRMEKVVKVLRHIEQRLKTMIEVWDLDDVTLKTRVAEFAAEPEKPESELLAASAGDREGLKQDDIDRVLVAGDGKTEISQEAPQPRPAQASAGTAAPRGLALEPLSLATLDAVKRAALFG